MFSIPPSGKRENPPSRPRLPGVVETDEGVFTSLRWRGGSRRGGDRGRSGRVRLASELWLGYERRARSGVQWAGLRGIRAALGSSLAPASARWTAPVPLPVYKGERAGSRGLSPAPLTSMFIHGEAGGRLEAGGSPAIGECGPLPACTCALGPLARGVCVNKSTGKMNE